MGVCADGVGVDLTQRTQRWDTDMTQRSQRGDTECTENTEPTEGLGFSGGGGADMRLCVIECTAVERSEPAERVQYDGSILITRCG
jgi:hypothetical protein